MEPFEPADSISDFIEFPPRDVIVDRLLAVEESAEEHEPLVEVIAERLGARTYERSASAFILIEILYDHEETHGGDMSYLLPRYVLTLTGDRDLALSALGAFNEIKDAIKIQGGDEKKRKKERATQEVSTLPEPPPAEEAGGDEAAEEVVAAAPEAPAPPAPAPAPALPAEPRREARELDQMMQRLQTAQKSLTDLGLSTRVSIDMAARRPTRERVSRTLQDIASLRSAMRRFEELLSQAELQVLEAAGVLWDEELGIGKARRIDDEE